jgi:predicted metalloprotease with PDZ domain
MPNGEISERGRELASLLERPEHHPKAIKLNTLVFTVLLSVCGSIIGLQVLTTLGITPNTALIGVLLANRFMKLSSEKNHRCLRVLLFLILAFTFGLPQRLTATERQPLSLSVDTTDIARKLVHSELAIPVHPGPLTLVYPRWAIPTYQFPTGALNNIVRLKISCKGSPLEWKRDLLDMFSFHVVVPADISILNISMDVVAPVHRSDLNAATAQLFVLDWNTVVLYPEGAATDEVPVRAQLRLPAGWKYACALAAARATNGVVEFPQTSLGILVDSPVLSGKYFKTVELRSDGAPPVFLDIAAETSEAADISVEWQTLFRRMIAEGGALFGGYPYAQYHFLLALSNEVGNDGLEHRQSSDIRMSLRSFSDEANRLAYGYLLPHEYVHSWNGKYRLPAGLVTHNFQEPQTTELLWVYEGLTRYLNWVLAARSGIFTLQEARDYAALLAAQTANRSGREWRTLQDTAVSAQFLNDAPDQWQSLRRGVDYYDESLFIWLEADTIIWRQTQGKRSLDDFCRTFFNPPSNSSEVKTYVFEDIVRTLNGVAEHDWKIFFETRLNATGTDRAPLDGLTANGWNLVYGDTVGSVQAARDKVHQTIEERFSLGLLLQEDGTVVDVVRDSPAWKAGLGPDMKILAANQRPWSPQALRDAIAADRNSTAPLILSVQNGSQTFQADVKDHQGTRYPRLVRNANPDVMTEILRPAGSLAKTP